MLFIALSQDWMEMDIRMEMDSEVHSSAARIATMDTQKFILADVLMKEISCQIPIVMEYPE